MRTLADLYIVVTQESSRPGMSGCGTSSERSLQWGLSGASDTRVHRASECNIAKAPGTQFAG